MLECRASELSRLSKVPRFTSILWRNQTPGSPQSVLDNSYLRLARNVSPSNGSSSSTTQLLDPSHPATKLRPQQLPSWQVDCIKIKLVPMALLQKPESQCSGEDPFTRNFVPWAERVRYARRAGIKVGSKGELIGEHNQRIEDCDLFPKTELGNKRLPGHRSVPQGPLNDLAMKKLAFRIPMSYLTATSKERMGQKTHMRHRVTTRIKTALNLIVTRGAYMDRNEIQNGAGQPKEDESEIKHIQSPRLSFDKEEASLMGQKWIMQGWSYIFYPTVEIYNMPYPKLVAILRHGLKFLYKTATDLERRWLQEALFPQSLLLLKYIQTDPTRPKKDLQGKPTNPAIEPSMHEHQVEMSKSTPDSAYGVVAKQQKTAPNSVSSTAVKPELWKKQLLSGLAIMEKRLGKRVRLSSKKKIPA